MKSEWTPVKLYGAQMAIIQALSDNGMGVGEGCAVLCGAIFEICRRAGIDPEKVIRANIETLCDAMKSEGVT